MRDIVLHHVSLVVTDLGRALDFYDRAFGFVRVERPPFHTSGAWLACGDTQIHLIVNPEGTLRPEPTVDVNDCHFAFRTTRFQEVLDHLLAAGFREDVGDEDPRRLVLQQQGLAGFPQLYVRDPDGNIVEVNGAPVEQPPAFRKAVA